MNAMILRLLLVCGGGPLACVVAGVSVLYLAWWMSRRDRDGIDESYSISD